MPYIVKNKIAFLSEASKILSSSLDYNVTLAVLTKLVTTSIADFCILDIVENNELKRLVVRVSDPKKTALAKRFQKFPPNPKNKRAIYEAARLGRPILIRKVSKTWLKTVSRINDEQETVINLGLKSMIFAPLKSRDKVIGVLTIGSTKKGFSYNHDDAVFIEELATRAGTAVDKARLYNEAQNAIRMRDEFLSIASHELKTPLTSILLNLQLVLERIKSATNKKADMDEIERLIEVNITQGKRLSKLINDLLNTSVISSGRLTIEHEPVNLHALVKNTISRMSSQINGIKVSINMKSKDKIVGYGDKIRLEQVITNLISNAIKYGNKKPIKIDVLKISDKAIIKFTDRGIGIDSQYQPYVFDLFTRAVDKNRYKGLGIGLYISRQIIEAHGGSLSLRSEKGKGSTFTIELPIED